MARKTDDGKLVVKRRDNFLFRYHSDEEFQGGVQEEYSPDAVKAIEFDGETAACARCGFLIADERVEGPIPAAAFDYTSEGLLCERCMNERDGGTPPHGPA